MAEDERKRLYGGSYDDEIRDTYQQIMSQPKFNYDLDGDALYQQYKDRYTQNAKLGMKDTMGQAAALTGGYGNSYAQGVGQQRYDETMRGLTDMIPQLEERAYQRWKGQGDALRDRYSMLNSMAATEQAGAQEAYSRLYALIGSTGYMPTAEELAAAGMSQEAADALRNEYLRQTGQLPAAGGSGNGNGGPGGPGYNPQYDPDTVPPGDEEKENNERKVNPQWDRDIAYITSQIGRAPNQQSAYTAMQSFLNSPYYEYASDEQKEAIRRAYEIATKGSGFGGALYNAAPKP